MVSGTTCFRRPPLTTPATRTDRFTRALKAYHVSFDPLNTLHSQNWHVNRELSTEGFLDCTCKLMVCAVWNKLLSLTKSLRGLCVKINAICCQNRALSLAELMHKRYDKVKASIKLFLGIRLEQTTTNSSDGSVTASKLDAVPWIHSIILVSIIGHIISKVYFMVFYGLRYFNQWKIYWEIIPLLS